MRTNLLSFIIPAYNEEKNISKTIEMIHKYTPSTFEYEIILVDHGSLDNTFELAKSLGAKALKVKDGTIAGLRNHGVEHSSGDVYIFLDADILLTQQWQDKIESVISLIRDGKRLLTGSWYSVPDKLSWIEKYWFKPLQNIDNTHINSGHMILSKSSFDELNGFDSNLETGEDYDISMRAKALGIKIVDDHDLRVIHEGYPKNLKDFMFREYWHGKGDSISLSVILNSKVALLSLMFSGLHILLLFSLFASLNSNLSIGILVAIGFICFLPSYIKFRHESFLVITVNSLLYYFYFVSRSASLLMGIFKRRIKKRQR